MLGRAEAEPRDRPQRAGRRFLPCVRSNTFASIGIVLLRFSRIRRGRVDSFMATLSVAAARGCSLVEIVCPSTTCGSFGILTMVFRRLQATAVHGCR